jgi:hypothetical protein
VKKNGREVKRLRNLAGRPMIQRTMTTESEKSVASNSGRKARNERDPRNGLKVLGTIRGMVDHYVSLPVA